MKKVAIITLNYNGKSDTLEFLSSLNKLRTTNYELRTIVVDNASSDGSVLAIHKQFPEVDVLQTGRNLGFSGGFNKGIEYAQIWGADYFLIVNNDTEFRDENLLEVLVKTLESDLKIGLVSPKIYFAKGFEFHKDRYASEQLGKVIWFGGGIFDWNNIGNTHTGVDQVDAGEFDEISEMEIFSGACVLIKKEVFEKIGFFDEKYFLYYEDSDFAIRAKKSGFKIYYNGTVSISHKISKSTGIGSEVTDYYHTRNRLIFGKIYASFRTNFALLRQSIKLLLLGRKAQKSGVLDYFKGKVGLSDEYTKAVGEVKYPLKLSIALVNYNTADLAKKLVESIFDKSSGFDERTMEVIVVDNGLLDPVENKLGEYKNRVKYLKNLENEGFTKGYNKTIKYSLGEYYLMFNSDIEVLKNGISELVKEEDKRNGEAVLGGKLYFPDMSDQDSVFHLPTISGAFNEYFLGKSGSYFMSLPKGEQPVKVEGFVMACFLIPKKILQKVGLLDEGTFIFFEDIEYSRRLKKFGISLYFVPSAKFIHHHGASTKKEGADKAMQHLIKASEHYHGKFYYTILTFILRLGQKFGRTKTPVSRWTK